MTFDQLEMLAAVVESGSFKAAAEELHKSQPSISMAIKKLEEEFSIKLFSRESYRPTLTPEGKAFYEKSKKALESFQNLESFGKQLSEGIEAEVSVSIDAICPLEKLRTPLWTYFYRPDSSTLTITTDILQGTEERVERDEVDLGIGPRLSNSPLLESFPLLKVKMIPVIGTAFAGSKKLDLAIFKEFPQIVIKSTGKKDTKTSFGLLSEGRKWYVTDSSLRKEIILNGLGWGRLPEHQIVEEMKCKKLVPINVEGIPSFEVELHVMRNKKRSLGPVAIAIWEYLRSGTYV